ncbi:serine-pyruvate aminotransferase/archaeal aspartate aminotransferase [Thermanaerovibrio velox DSM 12556]|uniref:Serine-pyruvate aminotransferase/archaeal aspartate aminotransferase n=1 Tax=Thermanaerovibrio velox DSM 12556 TaxID=926567 RepID=H0UN33_9BACT|nr:aminotransferase class V-fold PLP-dependent enzyme [Thermanaerovibrio velox]EHM09312.1 serine-pyruvate aminotransferase/archaeal aspartate aminotransferase [Thermanaerovibrio velox DSM 12556]
MERYPVGMIPGPVRCPEEVLIPYGEDFGSPDLEEDFVSLYRHCAFRIGRLLNAQGTVAIQSGEGMLALWGALNSVTSPGDRLLAVSSGVFGSGFAQMGRALGLEVDLLEFPFNSVPDPERVRARALSFRPKMITAVHCETPSGTISSLEPLGLIAREVDALFCVDLVSSAFGTWLDVEGSHIDLGLLGSQKCLSLPPDLCITTVSPRAARAVRQRNHQGYDALLPFLSAPEAGGFPYTHNWRALKALSVSLELIESEGLEEVIARHRRCSKMCIEGLQEMGVEIFPERQEYCSPTVTAAVVPDGITWRELDQRLRARGVALGGSYGPLAGKVFRIGHMGNQAREHLVRFVLDALSEVLCSLR